MTTREQLGAKLIDAVATEYNITVEQLKGKDRYLPLPEARAVLFYVGTRKLDLFMHEVAGLVNKKHPNAVTQGNKIEYRQEIYPELRYHINKIVEAIYTERANPYFLMYANLGGYAE